MAIAAAVGAATFTVTAGAPFAITTRAVAHALEQRTAVVLANPYDLATAEAGDGEETGSAPSTAMTPTKPSADPAVVEQVVRRLAAARRPLVLAGRDAWLSGAGSTPGRAGRRARRPGRHDGAGGQRRPRSPLQPGHRRRVRARAGRGADSPGRCRPGRRRPAEPVHHAVRGLLRRRRRRRADRRRRRRHPPAGGPVPAWRCRHGERRHPEWAPPRQGRRRRCPQMARGPAGPPRVRSP